MLWSIHSVQASYARTYILKPPIHVKPTRRERTSATTTLTGAHDDDGRKPRLAHTDVEPIGHWRVGERPVFQIFEGRDLHVFIYACVRWLKGLSTSQERSHVSLTMVHA